MTLNDMHIAEQMRADGGKKVDRKLLKLLIARIVG